MDERHLLSLAISIQNRIKKRIRENRITPKTKKDGGTTLVESSRLVNSIRHRISGDTIYIGTNLEYARIHHEGGIIRPKRKKYLAIPLCAVARVNRPEDFTDTFIAKGVIFQKTEGQKKPVALYALKKQVEIPARPFMYLDSSDEDFIKNQILQWMRGKIYGT